MRLVDVPSNSKGGVARVVISRREVTVKFKRTERNPGDTFTLSLADCPKDIEKYVSNQDKNFEWMVKMNADGSKMYSLHPAVGLYTVKTVRFAARDGQSPIPFRDGPRTGRTADGRTYTVDRLMFTTLNEIVEGDCRGLIIPIRLEYAFVEIDECAQVPNRRAAAVKKLARYMEVNGLMGEDSTEIPWSGNVLPDLEEAVVQEGRKFIVNMVNGYDDTLAPASNQRSTARKPASKKEVAPVKKSASSAKKTVAPKKATPATKSKAAGKTAKVKSTSTRRPVRGHDDEIPF